MKTGTGTSHTRKGLGGFGLLMLFMLTTLAPHLAYAQCSSPAGGAGDLMYNSSESVMQYCDNTDWIAMGPRSSPSAPSSGLIHHWTLNEASGSTANDSIGSDDGSLSGSPDWAAGAGGSGLRFDGSAQAVDMGDIADIRGVSELTLAAWMRRIAGSERVLVGKQSGGGPNAVAVEFWSDGNFYCGVSDNAAYAGGYIALNDALWHHVVMAFDGSQSGNANRLKCYIDGQEQALTYTGTVPATTSNDLGVNFGLGALGVAVSNGLIDDVRIYDRALSADEALTLYSATSASINQLVGHWKMDETSGTTAIDSSGLGHDSPMQGGLDASSDSAPGRIGTSLDLDGTDDWINAGADIDFAIREVSVSVWINPDDISNERGILSYSPDGGGSCWTHTYALVQLYDNVRFYHGGGGYHDTSSAPLQTGQWYHLVGVFSDSTDITRIYINGELVLDEGETGTPDTLGFGRELLIGREGCSTGFDGKLDDVRIYNYILTDQQVEDIYNGQDCLSSAAAGTMTYNAATNQMQYCNGLDWIAMGPPRDVQAPSSDLVAHWMLDESGNTSTASDSAGTNDGTLSNFPGNPSANWISGIVGNSLNFSGNNDRIIVADDPVLEPAQFTVSAWIKPSAVPQPSNATILTKRYSLLSNPWNSYILDVGNGDDFFFCASTGVSGSQVCLQETNVLTTDWQHVVGTYDGSDLNLYVNGALVDTQGFAGPIGYSAEGMYIGQSSYGGEEFDGQIDDIRLYDSALTAQEVADLYVATGGLGSCTSPAGLGGSLLYNTTHDVMQYCNGNAWVPVGKAP